MEEIAAVCREFGVHQLSVVGSAIHGTFDAEKSDLDFTVDLGAYEPTIARRYVRFDEALRNVFDRDIDLITIRTRGRRGFREDVIATRRVIHAA